MNIFKHQQVILLQLLVALFFGLIGLSAYAENKTLKLYHDADWGNHKASAQSIWRGIDTALSEIDHQIQGYNVQIVRKNHSGNVLKSKKNLESFLQDDRALAVFSGIHSPPLINNLQFINENKILTLVPWAAGGPITRFNEGGNWIYRLSVDDTKAGKVLADYALNDKSCKNPYLLLESSAWGDSNLRSINSAFSDLGQPKPPVLRFNWGLKYYKALGMMATIAQVSDCIILVSNSIEGRTIVKANEASQTPLAIISHWGIAAGNFVRELPAHEREKTDLSFIQTCFSFVSSDLDPFQSNVLAKALERYELDTASDIEAPTGFIHAYDLTRLLLAAVDQVVLTDDMQSNRLKVKQSLERLNTPVKGLIKSYLQPFTHFTDKTPDAHEALGHDDLCMAYFDNDNIIKLR